MTSRAFAARVLRMFALVAFAFLPMPWLYAKGIDVDFSLLIPPAKQAAPETKDPGSNFTLGPEWQLANRANNGFYSIAEFVRKGDDIHSWKELVTVQAFHGTRKSTPEEELNHLKALREKECPGATAWHVIDENENSVLYEWHVNQCANWPEQQEIARMLFGSDSLYFLRYTAKVHELTPETRAQWIKTFSLADAAGIAESGASPPAPRPDSEEVDGVIPMPMDKVVPALKSAMESQDCRVTESTDKKIECRRPRRATSRLGEDVGGESVTAVLETKGDQTRIHISTGKGFYGRLGKQNWSTPIYESMMKNLQGAQPKLNDTASQAGASSQPTPKTARDLARELSASWGQNSTGNIQLELKETSRTTAHGHTMVVYHFEYSGFPPGKTYTLWGMQSGDQLVLPLMGGFEVDASGRIVCPLTPPAGSLTPIGRPCIPTKTLEAAVSLEISGYHKGEPVDYAIVSTDGTLRMFARTYPFPIQAQDGSCRLNAELEDPKMTSFVIRGSGFQPGETLTTSSSFGKDATAGSQKTSATGEFTAAIRADVPGKNSGSATFTATGRSCHPTVTFEWGKAATKVQ